MSRRYLIAVLTSGLLANPTPAQESAKSAAPLKLPLPPPPIPPARKSPTDLFRELLAAPPTDRERLLTNRTPAARTLISTKLREFEALSPDQREIRLRVAELQFYLSPLLQATPDARPRLLAIAPEEVRPLLEDRLTAWDALPDDRRSDLLDSELSLALFARLQITPPSTLTNILRDVPPARRAALESQLARWKVMTPEQRAQKATDFQRFFELRAGEQAKVLRMISPAERDQMERTLNQFHELPAEQRERAVRGFRKFLEMSATDRAEFLRNAAKWQAMTPAERDAWRRVVDRATHPAPLPMPPERTRNRGVAMTNAAGR